MPTLTSMLITETKAALYARGLAVADALGISTTSWAAGDPTRSLYHFVAEGLEALEVNVAGYMASGFLDHAEGDWLTILAEQVYRVTRVEATFATVTIKLTNAGGGLYVVEAGDVVVKDSTGGMTYTNTEGGTLASGAGEELELSFTADLAGSDGTAAAGDIDTLVTTMLDVTCTNDLAAVGLDAESDADLRTRCRAKLGMLSAAGPRDAYNFVVRSSDLTGVSDITRSRTVGDTTTGVVTVYVASASGAAAGASVTAAQAAVEEWAAPVCITPTVTNASVVSVPVTYEIWMYDSVGELTATIEAAIETALGVMFAGRPIGGDVISPATTGKLYQSLITSTIKAVYPSDTFRVVVTAPAGDTSLTIGQVATLGAVTCTNVHQEATP